MSKKFSLIVAIILAVAVSSVAMAKTPNKGKSWVKATEAQKQIQKLLKTNVSTTTPGYLKFKTKTVTANGTTTTIVKPGKGGWKLGKLKNGKTCAKVPPGHVIAKGYIKMKLGGKVVSVPPCQKLPAGIAGRQGGTTTPLVIISTTTPATTTPTSSTSTQSATTT